MNSVLNLSKWAGSNGANISEFWVIGSVSPFQGLIHNLLVPRALPWAVVFCPFGAENLSNA